jgi:hypothetical protein
MQTFRRRPNHMRCAKFDSRHTLLPSKYDVSSNVNLPFRAATKRQAVIGALHAIGSINSVAIACPSALPLAGHAWPSRHHIREYRFWAAIPEVRHLTMSATYRLLSRQSFDCQPRMTSEANMHSKESVQG